MKAPLVTGLGMVSVVGADVVTACAAQRAGIVRRSPLDDVWAYDEGELEVRVTGAPIPELTEGFIQTGTWVRLALECVEDLVRYGRLPPPEDVAFWRATGLLWVVPEILFERFGWPEPEIPSLLEEFCARLLGRLSGLPFQQVPNGFFPQGPTGTGAALQRATELLQTGALRRVIVLASDSWMDRLSMGLLVRERRLKTGERPSGLCPGEAAACVLMERPEQAQERGATGEAVLLGAATRPSPGPLDEEDRGAARARMAPAVARNLVSAIAEVLGSARPFHGDILLDLNGEEWKARVWGYAQILLEGLVDLDHSKQVLPAVTFGDIGAASAAVGMCMATRSFVRRYASAERTLICSISDACDTAAVLVGRAK